MPRDLTSLRRASEASVTVVTVEAPRSKREEGEGEHGGLYDGTGGPHSLTHHWGLRRCGMQVVFGGTRSDLHRCCSNRIICCSGPPGCPLLPTYQDALI